MERGPSVPERVALFFGWARSPVWFRTPGEAGDVDPDALPVTEDLRQRLEAWNSFADSVLSAHDLNWPDARTEAEFTAAGSALAQDLRDELGIEVIYRPDGEIDTLSPGPPQPRRDHPSGSGWYAVTPLSEEVFRPPRTPESDHDQ